MARVYKITLLTLNSREVRQVGSELEMQSTIHCSSPGVLDRSHLNLRNHTRGVLVTVERTTRTDTAIDPYMCGGSGSSFVKPSFESGKSYQVVAIEGRDVSVVV
ncbi:hypothetical protein AcV7_004125 [Taiwanofungus camphoratus]|nr:hypothetical protein AcV7_004125 [Antrodia cinnamomea]